MKACDESRLRAMRADTTDVRQRGTTACDETSSMRTMRAETTEDRGREGR